MNILLINKTLVFGGIETILLTQYRAFKRLGHSVEIVLYKDKIEQEIENLDDIYFLKDYKNLKEFIKVRETKIQKYGLIISHPPSATIVKEVKKLQRREVLFVIHGMHSVKLEKGNILARYIRQKKMQFLYKNQNIVCVSDAVKDDIIQKVGIRPNKIQTIYNPFDLELLEKKAKIDIDLPTKREYIVWVGRIEKVKNLVLLIEIYRHLSMKYDLVIVGDGNEVIKGDLEKQIQKYKLEKNVFFIGKSKNPYPYIKYASSLLLTSLSEGLPTVFIESLLLNIPIFGVDIAANRELIEQFFTDGLLQGSTENMASHILQHSIKEVAYTKAKKCFNQEKSSLNYIAFIESL